MSDNATKIYIYYIYIYILATAADNDSPLVECLLYLVYQNINACLPYLVALVALQPCRTCTLALVPTCVYTVALDARVLHLYALAVLLHLCCTCVHLLHLLHFTLVLAVPACTFALVLHLFTLAALLHFTLVLHLFTLAALLHYTLVLHFGCTCPPDSPALVLAVLTFPNCSHTAGLCEFLLCRLPFEYLNKYFKISALLIISNHNV